MKRFFHTGIPWILAIIVVVAVFFHKTVVSGLLPVPSDSLVGLYHPWRDLYASQYPRGIPFRNFLITDPVRQQIPWRHTAIDAWKTGKFPGWDPFVFSGMSLAGNIQAGVFYPLNFIFFLMDFPAAWTVLIILQPLLAMVFMFWYLRRNALTAPASFFGSVVWGFSGFSISWLTWGTIGHVALWLPLLLLSIDAFVATNDIREKLRWMLCVVISIGMQLTAGHAQISLYLMGVTVVYGIARLWNAKGRGRSILLFISAYIAACFLTVPVWLPMLEVIRSSGRSTLGFFLREGWFFPWQHIVQFIAPDYFGNPATLNYTGVWNYGELVGYVGVAGMLFACITVCSGKRRLEKFWIVCIAASFLLMTPNFLAVLVYRMRIPVVSSLQPTRLLFIVDFALSFLAASGFERWRKGERKPIIPAVGFLCIGYAVAWIVALRLHASVSLHNLILPTVFFLAASFVIFLLPIMKRPMLRRLCITGMMLLAVCDGFRFGWKFTPFTAASLFFPKTAVTEFLSRKPGPFRILSVDEKVLVPNTFEYYGIESVSGYDPLYPSTYGSFINAVEKRTVSAPASERMIMPESPTTALLSLLNIRYIVSINPIEDDRFSLVLTEGETNVYEYTQWTPRVYLPNSWARLTNESDVLTKLSDPLFDPRKTSYIVDGTFGSADTAQDDRVTVSGYTSDTLTFEADIIGSERLAVVSTPNYAGWSASIDGKETKIANVNYLMMGIMIPRGKHTVIVRYK